MTDYKPIHQRVFESKCPGCKTPVRGRMVILQGGMVAYVANCRCGWRCDMEWRANEVRDLMIERHIYEVTK